MPGLPSPFGGNDDSEDSFADDDEFETLYLPEPGGFLDGQDVLTGDDHVEFHRITEAVFEERGVYDMTFGYNLARLNVDTRHPDAGFRYAEQRGDHSVLRAEFSPTTAFCPQSDTLTKGAFRAWNGLSERHDYELVRVRVAGTHQQSDEINDQLEQLEERYRETGTVASDSGDRIGPQGGKAGGPADGTGSTNRGSGPGAPF